jgi:hypothetical protein
MASASSHGRPNVDESASPAQFEIRLIPARNLILLRGVLNGNEAVRSELKKVLRSAQRNKNWIIDASKAEVVPQGVERWIEATREHLERCHLNYAPSQLAMVLQFDNTYAHPHSSYSEDFSA